MWYYNCPNNYNRHFHVTGGIITVDDLANYKVSVREPMKIPFDYGRFTLATAPPPSSGLIVGHILKVLSGRYFANKVTKYVLRVHKLN